MEKARIHSIETMGLVDGPGIRVVVFMQGCSLRCAYCHNPDTWKKGIGQEITTEELLKKVIRYKGFFKSSGGGVTLSGGEPLLQPRFLSEFFRMCRDEGIHTALDTAGYGLGDYDEVLKYTDLAILDIKHTTGKDYVELTGKSMDGLYEFLASLKKNKTPVWIRHVVVPGYTDGHEHIKRLGEFIASIPNVEKIELLPYHTYGVNKYREMGIPYRLEGVPPLDEYKLKSLYAILYKAIEERLGQISAGKTAFDLKKNEKKAV